MWKRINPHKDFELFEWIVKNKFNEDDYDKLDDYESEYYYGTWCDVCGQSPQTYTKQNEYCMYCRDSGSDTTNICWENDEFFN